MTTKTTEAIRQYCNHYGDKFIELMDRVGASNLLEVPESIAREYLKELEEMAS